MVLCQFWGTGISNVYQHLMCMKIHTCMRLWLQVLFELHFTAVPGNINSQLCQKALPVSTASACQLVVDLPHTLYFITQPAVGISSTVYCGSRCDSTYISPHPIIHYWPGFKWKLLTRTERLFGHSHTKYEQYSGPALFTRHTCTLKCMS